VAVTSLSHRGEENGRAILTSDQALLVYRLAMEGHYSQREIGELFAVSQSTVRDIKQRKTWSYLTEEGR
jgi:predicted transcriptional regulator